jgi:hypothetical protein
MTADDPAWTGECRRSKLATARRGSREVLKLARAVARRGAGDDWRGTGEYPTIKARPTTVRGAAKAGDGVRKMLELMRMVTRR